MSKRVKVCHVTTLTRRGGVETMLLDLLGAEHSPDVEHMAMVTSSSAELFAELKQTGVAVFQPGKKMRYDPRAIYRMAEWLQQNKVDIVHSYNFPVNCWAGMAIALSRTPMHITGEHGTIWNTRPPMLWLEKWFSRRADLIIANSRASKLMLNIRHGLSFQKIRVVENGIPAPPLSPSSEIIHLRQELNIPANDLVVGTVSRLTGLKDPWTFLRAAAIVLSTMENVTFLVVGGGPLEREIRRLAVELKISPKVVFTGWRRDVPQLMKLMDIFVLTSIREPFGNVFIEAAYAGIPAIGPDVDGVSEAIVDGKTGVLIKPILPLSQHPEILNWDLPKMCLYQGKLSPPLSIDPKMLAAAISDLLKSPTTRKNMGIYAAERANRSFKIERYVQALEDIYLQLAAFDRTDEKRK